MSTIIEIPVPDIGDFTDIPIIDIPVSVGDEIAADDTMITVESDKATLDVPCPTAGRIIDLKVREGDTISTGSIVLLLETANAVAAPTIPHAEGGVVEPVPVTSEEAPIRPSPPFVADAESSPPIATATGKPVYASPSVRKFGRTLGVDMANVSGSGPKGRITREDVEAFVKSRMTAPAGASAQGTHGNELPAWPKVDFSRFGPIERQPLPRIVKISGPALSRNSMLIPHVCNFDRSDVTSLEEFRKTLNAEAGPDDAKLTLLAFATKAVVSALKAYPKFNGSLDGDSIIVKNYWNIGVAADTPEGLVVPVIKQADQKGIREIAAEMADLAELARQGKLKAEDMQGATFTISSLGGIGGTGFTPIINAPEVAILGMTRAQIQPIWDGAAFVPRLIQPLSLSWDHRVVDGVAAARFLAHVSKVLGDFRHISV